MIRSGDVKFHPSLESLLIPIDRIRPHPDNPSNGDEGAIVGSIEVSGMYRPVWVQSSTGHILGGNTTYAACLDLGAEVIPVVWLDVDDEAALRILLGDNQLARLAVVDTGLLTPLLDTLMETELKLIGTGYPEPEPVSPIPDLDPTYTVTVNLSGELMAQWFDLPGETDREKLLHLMLGRYNG